MKITFMQITFIVFLLHCLLKPTACFASLAHLSTTNFLKKEATSNVSFSKGKDEIVMKPSLKGGAPWKTSFTILLNQKMKFPILVFDANSLNKKDGSFPGTLRVLIHRGDKKPIEQFYIQLKAKTKHSIQIPVHADFSNSPGYIEFHANFPYQETKISNLRILQGSGKETPKGLYYYLGSELDATWRIKAAKNISKYRKASKNISFVSSRGVPISNAKVSARLVSSNFLLGSGIDAKYILGNAKNRYLEYIHNNFDIVTPKNSLKWQSWIGEWKRKPGYNTKIIELLRSFASRNIMVRGHTLVWPSWRKSPTFLKNLDRSTLESEIEKHIVSISKETGSYIGHWDVVNELYKNNDFIKLLGSGSLKKWFHLARVNNPGTQLFINEYDILTGFDREKKVSWYLDVTSKLRGYGLLDAIGMQGHVKGYLTPPTEIIQTLDSFSNSKLPIYITEFDLPDGNDEFLANYFYDFFLAIYSNPNVKGFMVWDFWDGVSKNNKGVFFDKSWSLKKSGKVWQKIRDLVYTEINTKSDRFGRVTIDGNIGKYMVKIQTEKGIYSRIVNINPQNKQDVITIVEEVGKHNQI